MNSAPDSFGDSLKVFVPVFVSVFLLVAFSATIITFILPESFASVARLTIAPMVANSPMTIRGATPNQDAEMGFIQTQSVIIQSEVVLTRVIEHLELRTVWGKRYSNGEKLTTAEALRILRSRMVLRSLGNSTILELKAFSEDRAEAAALAGMIVKDYVDYALHNIPGAEVQVIDSPQVPSRPSRPNKPLNLVIGLLLGGLLGALTGAVAVMFTRLWRKRKLPPPGLADIFENKSGGL